MKRIKIIKYRILVLILLFVIEVSMFIGMGTTGVGADDLVRKVCLLNWPEGQVAMVYASDGSLGSRPGQ